MKIRLTYKFIIPLFLILFFSIKVIAQKTEKASISEICNQMPLSDFLEILQNKYGLKVYYKKSWVEPYQVSARFDSTPLEVVLTKIFENHPLSWQFFQDDAIVIYRKTIDPFKDSENNSGIVVIGDMMNVGKYKTAILEGVVVDGKNGEPITGAIIYESLLKKAVSSNNKGEFEIELPTGNHELQLNFMGFQNTYYKIKLIETGKTTFQIFQETHNIDEITILGTNKDLPKAQMGMVQMTSAEIKKLPALMGETDIIKGMTMMAGVQTVSELSPGFNVRGGNTDQNLILINGSPVFNASHLFGFLSLINPDVVEDVRLFKGGVPVKYGERVSSVMEVGFKEGSDQNVRINGGIGLINSRLAVEGPLSKNKKITFVAGGRASYTDWVLKQIPDVNISQSVANFYDISGMVTWNYDKYNKLSTMGYYSRDEYSTGVQSVNQYSSALGNLTLNNRFSEKLYGALELAYSKYNYQLTDYANQNPLESYYLKNSLEYVSGAYNFRWHISPSHKTDLGFKVVYNKVLPGETNPINSPSLIVNKALDSENLIENAVYISDEFNLAANFSIVAGLRYIWAANLGESVVKLYNPDQPLEPGNVYDSIAYRPGQIVASYGGIEPRLMLNFDLNDNTALKLNYQRIRQHIFQLSNAAIVSPAESWKTVDYYVKPLISDQISLVAEKYSTQKNTRFVTELYYKNLQNLVEYKNGTELLMNENIETALVPTKGYSYGIELSAEKNTGKFAGYISYVFSVTKQKNTSRFDYENLWQGNYYRSLYDRPHDLTTTATFNITRRWRVSGNFVFMSGRPVTLPEIKYQFADKQLIYYSDRNKYRMPPYHRADISMTLDENLRKKRMWKGSWTLSVYNLYGRRNPYSVYYKKSIPNENNDFRSYSLYKLSVIGVPVPSLTYNFKF